MAKAYYSVMLYHPAEEVWAVIRPFDHYAWAGVDSETIIHSDIDRSYSYGFCGAPPVPVRDYVATIRVSPAIADAGSFVEWWATFDCAPEERDQWMKHFETEGFSKWLAALRRYMSNGGVHA